MHPETKNNTKNIPYPTLTENLKLQLSPGLVASYDIQPGNGVGLYWDKHTHVSLLTYLPRTHTGHLMTDHTPKCLPRVTSTHCDRLYVQAGFPCLHVMTNSQTKDKMNNKMSHVNDIDRICSTSCAERTI